VGDELRVRLLGGFEAVGVEPSAFGSRKVRTLVARLALAGGTAVDAAALVDALWPAHPPARPSEQVAVLASRARGVLGRERLVYRDAGYSLQLDWLDVDALDDLTDEAERRLTAQQPASARAAATSALALCRGPLLPEEPDAAWTQMRRQAVERQIGRARRLLAEASLLAGAAPEAIDAATAALDRDPYDEPALRLLLRACAAAGRPATGLLTYEHTRQLLADELGTDPDQETQRLHVNLLRGAPLDPAESRRPPAADLPGRDRQIALLDAALSDVQSRGGAAVVDVYGEAGIGKTRLLQAFGARVGTHTVIGVGRCDEHRRSLPLQPIVDAVRNALTAVDADTRLTLLGAQPLMASLLADVTGVDVPDFGDGQLQSLAFRALAEVLRGVAAGRPVVLLLDDIHLADATTLAWIAYTAENAAWPLLIVVTRRIEHAPALAATTAIELGPLDEAAVATVVGPQRAKDLHQRTGGHPLFLQLLAESPAGTDQLSTRIVDSIADRVNETGDAAPTLHAAAVIGSRIDVDLLAQVLDRPIGELLDHLEAGVRCRLLAQDEAGFSFVHALVRDALVATTSPSRRAWLHRQTAAWLSERPAADPAELAHHARLAGDTALTAHGLVRAADIASRRFAHETALELLDEAAVLTPGADVQRRRVRVLLRLSRHGEATQAASMAVADEPDAASYECLAQAVYYDGRDCDRTAELARVAAARSDDPAQVLRCLALAGRALHGVGRLREADEAFDEAESRSAAGSALPDARLYRGALRFHQGRSAEAVTLLSTDAAATDTLAFAPVMGAMMRGLAHAELGHPLAALADFDRFAILADQRQLTRYGGRAENCRGYILRNLGRVDEAREWHQQAAEIAMGIRQPEPQAHAMLDLADICLDDGDVQAAAGLLHRADEFATRDHVFRWRHVLRSSLLHARLSMACGQPAHAAELTAELVTRASEDGVARYVVLGRLSFAAARHLGGHDVDRARINADLLALDDLAGMDGWRLTQDMATRFGVDEWRRLANHRVDVLRQRAGDLGADLPRYAEARS
jgi:DNA-binding SARP family transcriptional activator/tetratricopeptide (TPR) repeat protein